jgi:uncharacterized protein DUF3850
LEAVIHELKVDPAMWDRLADRSKTFELRRDDRGFQSGDELVLWRFDATDHDCTDTTCSKNYRGPSRSSRHYRVGFVAKGTFYGLQLGEYAILSLIPFLLPAEEKSCGE